MKIISEALLFAQYLGIKTLDTDLFEQYDKGTRILKLDLSIHEQQIMRTLCRFPFLLPFADAGFALTSTGKTIRKRILLMAALIETDKKYYSMFITEQDTPTGILKFLYRGVSAVIKGCLGILLLILLRWI